ncbi:CpaE family protein [Desulfurivibrio sp. C05AmB]|uniref:AAA family ATPase n=1 Tax=Desulfurivibrio sp. C05AmB TaxID=3374371 RepID=UPI00376F42E2
MIITLNVVAVVVHKDTGDQIADALSRVKGINLSIRIADAGRSLGKIGEDEMPDVIILEINGQAGQDVEDVEEILGRGDDQVKIFATYRQGDNNILRRLFRAGVKNIYPQPLETQDLVLDLVEVMAEKRNRAMQAQSRKGSVTAFMNAKGGSGATTIATNVAHTLATKYKAKVALIDFDIQFGCAAMSLDLKFGADVCNAIFQPDRIDPIFIKALMTRHESGLHVLASPGNLGSIDGIKPGAATDLLQGVINLYDIVIIDLPRLFLPWTIEVLQLANPVMLVSHNNLVTIRDTKLILEHLPLQGVPAERIEVINNRAKAKVASVDIGEMKKTLKLERIHRVTNDYSTAVKAQDRGVPLAEISRRSPLTRDIEHLADYLYAARDGQEPPGRGLMDRLF